MPGEYGVLAIYKLFPWSLTVKYQVERTNGELLVTVSQCPAQEGRHLVDFQAFARVIAPSVRVGCLFAPSDEHPTDCDCKWRFYERCWAEAHQGQRRSKAIKLKVAPPNARFQGHGRSGPMTPREWKAR